MKESKQELKPLAVDRIVIDFTINIACISLNKDGT
jgi:hypothetical protein